MEYRIPFYLDLLYKIIFVIILILLIYFVYVKFVYKNIKDKYYREYFDISDNIKFADTIYEKAINTIYNNNDLMRCNLLDCIDKNITRKKFAIHMLKLTSGKILAVF